MISIITTIYNNDKYLVEALNSFIESCNGYDYEILIGIDNCKISLKHILTIYPSLNGRIKIFYFTNKVGTYIIRNTLATKAKNDNLIFFDSDDVMRKNTVKNTLDALRSGYQYHRFGFISFSGTLTIPKDGKLNTKFSHHFGAFGIKKELFLEMNGFEPWICAADGEFFWRVGANQHKTSLSKDVDILYRRHESNLTSGPTTGMQSPLRKEYHRRKDVKMRNNLKGPLPNLTTSQSVIVDNNFYQKYYKSTINELSEIDGEFKFTIIIPTFGHPNYLDECLKSVITSIKNLQCEILVGVDNCQETFDFIFNNSFDDRINFFKFEKNVGPYIIKNSLSKISKSDYILFFDSDDIMTEQLIQDIMNKKITHNLIKLMYLDFDDDVKNINMEILNTNTYGEGVFGIDKDLFLSMNGFEGWRCAADSDLMNRLYKNNVKLTHTKSLGFYRRVHKDSLTQHPETNLSSQMRGKYSNLSKQRKTFGPLDDLITHPFVELFSQKTINGEYDKFLIGKEKINTLLTDVIKLNVKPRNSDSKINYDLINHVLSKTDVYHPSKNVKPIREHVPNDRNELIQIKKGTLAAQNREFFPQKRKRDDSNNPFSKKGKR